MERFHPEDPEWAAPLLCRSELRGVAMNHVRAGNVTVESAVASVRAAEWVLARREFLVATDRVLKLARASGAPATTADVALAEELGVALYTFDRRYWKPFRAPRGRRSPLPTTVKMHLLSREKGWIQLAGVFAACGEVPTEPAELDLTPTLSNSTSSADTDGDGVPDADDVEPNLNNNYHYVDWTAANPAGGTASGTITLPDDQTIGVDLRVVNPDGSAGYFYAPPTQTECGTRWWEPTTPHVSGYVLSPPPPCDFIGLTGGTLSSYVITFSAPVQDPAMAIQSLGRPGGATRVRRDRL